MGQNEIILNAFLIARVCSIHFAESCFEKKPDHLIVPALIYVAGYVAHRFRLKYPTLGIPTQEMPATNPPNWVCHVSRGNLIYPSDELYKVAQILEKVFEAFHKNYLSDSNLIFQKVAALIKLQLHDNDFIPDEVLLCLVRTRTYIRLRELNKARKDSYKKIRIVARSAKTQKFYS